MRILRIAVAFLFVIVLCLFIFFQIQQRGADKSYPVITIDNDVLHVSISATDADLLEGVTAYDEKDGDISHKVIVESISRFTTPGESVVVYAVCDEDNHAVSASRKIVYTDYTAPRFTLSGSLVFGISQNINIRGLLGAVDSIDGNISDKVIITANEYTSNVAGVNYISAKVTNSKGDMILIQLPVYVEEMHLSAPVIELEHYMLYLKVGDYLDPQANLISALDSAENDISEYVQLDTNLNTREAGIYEVHYRVTDSSGRREHAILTVIVEE
ncbi:MAG: DUF5011 domain-containing protein [Clostridia bacterium]|nr:DUF5011 domain-containing protein [Clostridia bacterium]